ncbi:glycosyltransferase family 2 protein [Pirellulaceae bacterium SH449]
MMSTPIQSESAVVAHTDNEPFLTVVMPCLNEAETIGGCIAECQATFRSAGLAGEIVVGDNGSTDGSQQIATSSGAVVIHVPTRGYGAAIWAAIQAASTNYIVMGDSDGSYDFSQIPTFIAKLDAGYELVVGDRFAGGIAPGAMPWLHRYLGNPVLSLVGRLLFRSTVHDFHCGIRAFRRDAILSLNCKSTGMEFASEMIAKSALAGLKVGQVPARLRKAGRSRPPHLRPWRDGWRHLQYMLSERMSSLPVLPERGVFSTQSRSETRIR